ncbi:shikimate dehydrogenase [Limnobacter humi]|uniref:Shikimate dehydrogenase (NADP(+)) n=1 Tax=Limnobacter humi TaxID=1778671 RepID=A0ABT1WHW0_9BURK|nr:shikimate dehydrogenase [Limnobacter humi]MCQ8896999.1 shikimate dehydrogenase [Limnobacter humi]
MSTPLRLVVLGNPIAHSKSPAIHRDFASQLGLSVQYERVLAPLQGFDGTVRALRAAGVAGANVTVPFKQAAFELAGQYSEGAQFAEAANTLVFSPEGIYADNTDGGGLCRDLNRQLQAHQLSLADCEVLLLGAGGAASGCIAAFKQHGVQALTILNRTVHKAEALALRANRIGLPATGAGFDTKAIATGLPRVVVNASSASLNGEVPVMDVAWYRDAVLAYDMMYGAETTAFMKHVARVNPALLISDGLGMLVFQAALAFEIWTGRTPDALMTLARMREGLGQQHG